MERKERVGIPAWGIWLGGGHSKGKMGRLGLGPSHEGLEWVGKGVVLGTTGSLVPGFCF